MNHLLTIYGIGPVLAEVILHKLIELGYDKKLLTANDNSYTKKDIYRMLKTPSVYDGLPESAKVYLKYLPDRRIPRAVIEVLDIELHNRITGTRLQVAGSYRRGRPTSNDADIVVVQRGDVLTKIQDCMKLSKTIEMQLPYASGPDRASVLFIVSVNKKKIGVRKSKYVVKSDIFLTSASDYIFMLLYATGSGGFNILMRSQAKRRGLLLNQRGLYNGDGTKVPIANEHEIFDKVGVKYKTPEKREVTIKKIKQ